MKGFFLTLHIIIFLLSPAVPTPTLCLARFRVPSGSRLWVVGGLAITLFQPAPYLPSGRLSPQFSIHFHCSLSQASLPHFWARDWYFWQIPREMLHQRSQVGCCGASAMPGGVLSLDPASGIRCWLDGWLQIQIKEIPWL